MSIGLQTQVKRAPSSSFAPVRSFLLQRECACGGTPGPTGECQECRKERLGLQHKGTQPSTFDPQTSEVPPIVQEVLRSPGQPLDAATRAFIEPRFGHDFSGVRVHTDAKAAESAQAVNALAYTAGRSVAFAAGQYAPRSESGRRLLAHELAHVVQQGPIVPRPSEDIGLGQPDDSLELEADRVASTVADQRSKGGVFESGPLAREAPGEPLIHRVPTLSAYRGVVRPVIQCKAEGANSPTTPSHPQRLEFEVVGSDATLDEPLAVMADRWAHDHGGRVLRVSSLENMIRQIEALVGASTCLGSLVVWYHGSPEIQLVVGEYELSRLKRRLPASGFTREWLQLERNHAALTRFRQLFCCDALIQWMGCGTATVRASGGLRTPQELEREPALLQEYPDIYRSSQEAQQHGAKLTGASFGKINIQAWANATCTTIRSATNLVTLRPESKNPITIDNGGVWIDVRPEGECPCDPKTGRVSGEAPSRKELVKSWHKQITALVGHENVIWHELVLALRTGIPHATEVVGAGAHGERTFQAQPGTLSAALITEMKNRVGSKRGPLENYYTVHVLFPLLQIAGAGITPPGPLPSVPMPNHLFVRIAVGGTWAAVTQPHLAVVNRDDFWHWMVFNDQAIGETPEFTRTVIQHELEHAADFENDLRAFEAIHPRPNSKPPDAFGLPAEETVVRSFSGEWGKYINDFIDFQKSRTRPERHLEIVLGQRRQTAPRGQASWNLWSAGERAYWFQLVFHNLPPDVKRGSPLSGEDEVLATFRGADPDLKLAAVERAYDTIKAAICPEKNAKLPEIVAARANARTLVQHFDPIIERVLHEQMRDTPRETVLNQLRRPPEHPRGMECQL